MVAKLEGDEAGVDDAAGDAGSCVTGRQTGGHSTSTQVIHVRMNLQHIQSTIRCSSVVNAHPTQTDAF